MRFESELTRFAVKADGVQRLAGDLSTARAALQLEGPTAAVVFDSAGDIPAYSQKLAAYLSLVKGFTETVTTSEDATALQPSVSSTDESAGAALRQPLVEGAGDSEGAHGAAPATAASDCSGCLNFCRWQDALTGSTLYALSARHEMAHTLLAAGILMMTEARSKVDALLSERLSELNETQLKLAYQLLLSAAGVFNSCLGSMDITPQAIGAAFTELGQTSEATGSKDTSPDSSEAVPDDDMMARWREEQRQAQQASSRSVPESGGLVKSASPGAQEDLDMLKRVPDLANGSFPQLLAWVSLAQAQELVILRGVTREAVDFSLMAKLSMDISARYQECYRFATRKLPCSTSKTAESIQACCAFKGPYYQAISMYFQGASCMVKEDARNCAQAVADFKSAAALFDKVVSLEKKYESALDAIKEERGRVALLASVFLRSQQIIDRDLDIVTHRNDSVYYEPIPGPENPCEALSLVKATAFPAVAVSDLWRDGEVANCLKPTAPTAASTADNQQSSRPREGCCSSCIIS